MIKYILVAASLLLVSNAAEARHYRHHYYHHYTHHYRHQQHYTRHYRHAYRQYARVQPQTDWFGSWSGSPTGNESSVVGAISRPAHAIYGHLVCALNVNSALAERGIKGTGSAAAMSFMHWGHSTHGVPVPGAVIVSGRRGGGHVAIVSHVENGHVMAWNASEHSGWRLIRYPLHVIDYRVPG